MRNPSEISEGVVTPIATPAACPACRASIVTTTSKTVSAETYWRCVSCGEVWNVARRDAEARRAPSSWGFGGGGRRYGGR